MKPPFYFFIYAPKRSGSGMLIPDPGLFSIHYLFKIPDLKSRIWDSTTKKTIGKKLLSYFFGAINFNKLIF
jgi:hypothetical protein